MATTPTTSPAIEPDDLWPMDFLVRMNWKDPLIIRHAYQTRIVNALSDAEQRRATIFNPSTLVTFPFSHWDDMHEIQMFLMRSGIAMTLVPIWMDKVTLGPVGGEIQGFYTATNPGQFFIRNSYETRQAIRQRIKKKQRVLLWQKSTDTKVIAEITATNVTEEQGVLYRTDGDFTSLTGTFVVFPLVEARLVTDSSVQILSSLVAEGIVEYVNDGNRITNILEDQGGLGFLDEVPGGNALEGYDLYDDKPVFSSPISWGDGVTMTMSRSGQFNQSGVDSIPTVLGSRPRVGYRFTVRALTRTKAWKFKRLFDWSLGRCFSWWFVSPTREFEVLAITGTLIAVTVQGDENDWNYRPYIAVVGYDGTTEVRKVVSVVRTPGVFDLITVDASFTLTMSTTRRVAVARNVRFVTDELIEMWSSTETCDFPVEVIEVVNEKDVAILRPGGYGSELEAPNAIPLSDTWSPDGCTTVL